MNAAFDKYAVQLRGPEAGGPAKLYDFQREYVNAIYAREPDGSRKHNKVFLCGPKKIGKSFVFGHIAVFETTLFAKKGGHVYSIASSFKQGSEIYDPAHAVGKHSPRLQPLGLELRPSTQEIRFPAMETKFAVLSTKPEKLHGKAPRVLLVDELHAIHDRKSFDNVFEGMGVWESLDPVDSYFVVYITNWGEIGSSPAFWDELRYARKVQEDPDFDPTYCALISEPPENMREDVDELLKSPKTWYEFHDGLRGGLITERFLRNRAQEALTTPSLKNTIVRLHFCRPTAHESAAFDLLQYDKCVDDEFSIEEMFGRVCFGGLDLAATTDLCAFALLFPEGEVEADLNEEDLYDDEGSRPVWAEALEGVSRMLPKYAIYVQFWAAEDRLPELEKITERPLRQWAKEGLLHTTKGSVVDDKEIELVIRKAFETFQLQSFGMDPKFGSRLHRELTDDGFPVVKLRQSSDIFTPSWRTFEQAYLQGRARIDPNPLLRWNASSFMLRTFNDGGLLPGKIERLKEKRRIDGWVAALMAEYCRIHDLASPPVEEVYL